MEEGVEELGYHGVTGFSGCVSIRWALKTQVYNLRFNIKCISIEEIYNIY